MDFISALIFFFVIFFLISCCGYCCSSKRKGTVFSTPVVVTSVTTAAPAGYPTTHTHMSTGGYPAQVYTNPYPSYGAAPAVVQMPMPMNTANSQMQSSHLPPGFQPHTVPYPPVAMGPGSSMNPPPYDHVVGQGAGAQQQSAPYEKQAPYNPNYTSH